MYGILIIVSFLVLTMAIISSAPYIAGLLIIVFIVWLIMKDEDKPPGGDQT